MDFFLASTLCLASIHVSPPRTFCLHVSPSRLASTCWSTPPSPCRRHVSPPVHVSPPRLASMCRLHVSYVSPSCPASTSRLHVSPPRLVSTSVCLSSCLPASGFESGRVRNEEQVRVRARGLIRSQERLKEAVERWRCSVFTCHLSPVAFPGRFVYIT